MPDPRSVTLLGKVFLRGNIRALSGLHIGGSAGALAIGGVDNPVIRDPLTTQPYIPGSSIKGKLRSLAEKRGGLPQNFRIGQDVYVHTCEREQDYTACPVCPALGIPADSFALPTRLTVRDVPLTEASAEQLRQLRTDLPFAEVKWEAAIDRVTSSATPRQMERVPAGAVFGPFEIVFGVYLPSDVALLGGLLLALQLLEDDALGGQGSRGSGKVRFEEIAVTARRSADYGTERRFAPSTGPLTVGTLVEQGENLLAWVRELLEPRGGD